MTVRYVEVTLVRPTMNSMYPGSIMLGWQVRTLAVGKLVGRGAVTKRNNCGAMNALRSLSSTVI